MVKFARSGRQDGYLEVRATSRGLDCFGHARDIGHQLRLVADAADGRSYTLEGEPARLQILAFLAEAMEQDGAAWHRQPDLDEVAGRLRRQELPDAPESS
jgi:hypothetical protein